jgi:hypothetical protein
MGIKGHETVQRQEGEGRGQGAERCTSLVELRNRTQSIGLVHGACSHVVAPLPKRSKGFQPNVFLPMPWRIEWLVRTCNRPYYGPQQNSAGSHIGMWREERPKSARFPQARAGLHSRRRRSPRSAAAPRGDCIPRLGAWDGSVPSFAARLALCGLLEPWGAVPPPRHSPDVALMNRRSRTTHCSRTACRTV